MSGRSAAARMRKEKQADQRYQQQHYDNYLRAQRSQAPQFQHDTSQYWVPESRDFAPSFDPQGSGSVDGTPYGLNREEQSYMYKPPPPSKQQVRPIIIASAVEKSDFRTHLDGMTDSVRGKLGRFVGGNAAKQKPVAAPASAPARPPPVPSASYRRASMTIIPPPPPESSGSPSHSASAISMGASSSYAPPSTRQTTAHRSRSDERNNGPPIGVFQGGGRVNYHDWSSRMVSPELMDPNGDTIVYIFGDRHETKPVATFRVLAQTLFDRGCRTFTKDLREATTGRSWLGSATLDLQSLDGRKSQPDSSSSGESHGGGLPKLSMSADSESIGMPPTPDNSSLLDSESSLPVRYKLKLVYPGERIGLDVTAWLLATRNFFAIVYGANSLCGVLLYDALKVLAARMREQPECLADDIDKNELLIKYLIDNRFDDVRDNVAHATSILAFSELPGVQWTAGYTEAFIHCVGMFHAGYANNPAWRCISPRSRIFIENAAMEAEPRLRRAQNFLADFAFGDIWPAKISTKTCARAAFDRFRHWLLQHCAERTPAGVWPPPANTKGLWLTRDLLVMLRELFVSLFDFLADHDVVFDDLDSGNWSIISKTGRNFKPDLGVELPITSMLVGFDENHGFDHMPHPYPMRPTAPESGNKARLGRKTSMTKLENEHYLQRKGMSYVEASNLYTAQELSDVIADFNAFERSDMLEMIDPTAARLGRWVLIYAVLQVLSTVAVDCPSVRYSDRSSFHLNTTTRGIPPWHSQHSTEQSSEPQPSLFHTFTAPSQWTTTIPKARSNAHKAIMFGDYGDGRTRADFNIERARAAARAAGKPSSNRASPSNGDDGDEPSDLPSPQHLAAPMANHGHSPSSSNGSLAMQAMRRSEGESLHGRPSGRGTNGHPGLNASTGHLSPMSPMSPNSPMSLMHEERGSGNIHSHNYTTNKTNSHSHSPSQSTSQTIGSTSSVGLRDPNSSKRPQDRAHREQERLRERRAEAHGFTDYRGEPGW